MKSINNILKGVMAATLVALTMTACQPEPEVITPKFPASVVEASVEAGEVFKFTIEPNMDWKLNIPSEQFAYFKLILTNGKEDLVQRGSAGTHEISVAVVDQVDFNTSRTCEITLTMAGQTQIVAKLTKEKLQRRADLYVAGYNAEEESFSQDENGNWIYNETSVTNVDLVWNNSQWMQRIKVDANFNWTLQGMPEWMITNEITGGEAGATEIFIRVDDSKWPLDATDSTLDLCDMSTDTNGDGSINAEDKLIVNSFTLHLEGCRSILTWSLGEELKFNVEGQYYQASSYSYVESVSGSLIAPYDAVTLYKLTYYNGRYWVADDTDYSSWLTVAMSDYPEGASAEAGVWERSVTITSEPTPYTTARKCVLLLIPAAVAQNITSATALVLSDNSDIVEEYKQYVVSTITQAGTADEVLKAIDVESIDAMRASGGSFEEISSDKYPGGGKWSSVPNGYLLTYNGNNAGTDLLFGNEFASYEIYGPQGKYEVENCWICITPSEVTHPDGTLYRVTMRLKSEVSTRAGEDEEEVKELFPNTQPTANGGNEATFVFYDESGTAFALLHCVLDPTFDPYAGLEDPIQFVNPQAAVAAGAKLERIKPGEDYYDGDAVSNGQALYRLTCNPAYNTIELTVPSYSSTWDTYEQNKGLITATKVSNRKVRISISATESLIGGRVSLFSGSGAVGHIVIYYNVN